jgi:S-adenosylmethionine synthetase
MDKTGRWLFSSESVTEGHPDKICDQISDAILDAILEQDPMARVACEIAVTTGMVLVMGEITTTAYADIPLIARNTISDIGYVGHETGFDASACAILSSINEQSPDIAMGVDHSLENREGSEMDEFATGAGDQGMMFGYANQDTPELMPLPISLAHALCRRLAQVRHAGASQLRPDGKAQVTIEYDGKIPVHVHTVVVSTQHAPEVQQEDLRTFIIEQVIRPVLPTGLFDDQTRVLVNPTGRFVVGGPQGDSGLTGRKIIVDTYGGFACHGGGSFSGKDPTKVDRSAAYAARYAAKNIVAAGIAAECEIQVAYAIGVAHPVSVTVNTFRSGLIPDRQIEQLIQKHFDFRPAAIISRFDLRRPIYRQCATYGHLGRPDLDLPWERTDLASVLLADAGL